MVVEPADRIAYAGWSARRDGILGGSARALHLTVAAPARRDARESYVSILSEFLAQAATLPVGR